MGLGAAAALTQPAAALLGGSAERGSAPSGDSPERCRGTPLLTTAPPAPLQPAGIDTIRSPAVLAVQKRCIPAESGATWSGGASLRRAIGTLQVPFPGEPAEALRRGVRNSGTLRCAQRSAPSRRAAPQRSPPAAPLGPGAARPAPLLSRPPPSAGRAARPPACPAPPAPRPAAAPPRGHPGTAPASRRRKRRSRPGASRSALACGRWDSPRLSPLPRGPPRTLSPPAEGTGRGEFPRAGVWGGKPERGSAGGPGGGPGRAPLPALGRGGRARRGWSGARRERRRRPPPQPGPACRLGGEALVCRRPGNAAPSLPRPAGAPIPAPGSPRRRGPGYSFTQLLCPPTLRFARRIYWLHGKKIGSRKGYVVFAASAEFIPPLGTAQTSQEGPGCSVGNSGAFPARRVWERWAQLGWQHGRWLGNPGEFGSQMAAAVCYHSRLHSVTSWQIETSCKNLSANVVRLFTNRTCDCKGSFF